MPGRPRKPSKLHAIQGTRPGATNRDRGHEPQSDPLGPPPPGLRQNKRDKLFELDCWEEIVGALPLGVAQEADRFTIEICARLLAKMRSRFGITAAEMGALQRGLASLGMTPADRSKVAAPEPQDDQRSPWDGLGVVKGGK